MSSSIHIERFSGLALEKYISDLARLRIEVFRDFPYLYDGDLEYEENYLKTYINCPESTIVLAFHALQQRVGSGNSADTLVDQLQRLLLQLLGAVAVLISQYFYADFLQRKINHRFLAQIGRIGHIAVLV